MNRFKAWWIGFILVITFIFLSEAIIVFKEYVYNRLWLDRNLVLTLLWILPALASFTAVYFSQDKKIILGLSYIPILSLLGPAVHFLVGQLGVTIDFRGLEGIKVTFQIYLILSVIIIGIGSIAGIVLSKMVGSNKK